MFDSRLLSIESTEEEGKLPWKDWYSRQSHRNIKLSEAPSHGEPIIAYDASSKGAENYLTLAQEIIAKELKQWRNEQWERPSAILAMRLQR